MQAGILIVLLLLSQNLCAVTNFEREEIIKRISPVGQVRIKDDGAKPQASATEVKASEKSEPGQETYETHCIVCHRDGVAGAPKYRVSADWEPRLSKQKLEGLLSTAIKGLNAMPPKGTCTDCTDAELKAAIEYMLPRK